MKQVVEKNDVSDKFGIDSGYVLSRLEYMKKNTKTSQPKKQESESDDEQIDVGINRSQRIRRFEEESFQDVEQDQVSYNTERPGLKKSIYRTFINTIKKQQKEKENIVHKQKIDNVVNNFVKKIRMNNAYSKEVDFQPFDQDIEQEKGDQRQGITIPPIPLNIILVFSILHTLTTCIIATFTLVFKETVKDEWINTFAIVSIIWMLFEMFLGFTRKTYVGSVKLRKLREISGNYLSKQFIIDVVCVAVLLFDIIVDVEFQRLVGMLFLLKISDALEKLTKLEIRFVDTTYKEHWWELIKIFMTNFLFAHVLAIVLIMISWIDEKQSWLMKIGALEAPWYERYAWSYYGGTTIMLTVGFGDIAAGNYKEALCLTIIETLSCIALAYNIHCVGTLISSIRNEEIEKNKKIKLLRNLSEKDNISNDLTAKINNYILESSIIKKKFNFEENKNFIDSLPGSLKSDFLRQSNKKIFNDIQFFRNFTDRTLVKLAEKVDMMIAHPEQVVLKKSQWNKIMILKSGEIGLCAKMRDSKFNNTVIDKLTVKENEDPKILSLEFISPENIKNYQAKSKQYSILFSIEMEDFLEVIKDYQYDFQYFHQKKDIEKRNLGQYEIFYCEHCKQKHSKFKCPKLHFVPLPQQVINKYLYQKKHTKNPREKNWRVDKSAYHKSLTYKPLKGFEKLNLLMKDSGYSSCFGSIDNVKYECVSLDKQNVKTKSSDNIKQMILTQISMKEKQFWKNESDKLNDYKFYFPFHNPKNLRSNCRSIRKRKRLTNQLIEYQRINI